MLEQFLNQLANTTWVEWLGMTAGISGVWLSIKEKIAAWPLFITCYSCYVYISYQYGLHAFMGMNIVFIAISLYGFWKWARNRDGGDDQLPITRTKKAHWPLVGLFLVLGTLGIGWWLDSREEANLPYLDAFATCCGFVAQWMLGRKHIETWFFWIVSDIVYLGIFLQGPSWPSVILFTVFIILAIKGWKEWKPLVN
ncbi:MAG TPA: nicotinamide riboside transporter PnuC [Opitutales bacterium]|nr:nicotinamide riboside transporter PnuC [Opitutales bacterium]